MSLATRRLLALVTLLGSVALSDGSVGTDARSAAVHAAAVVDDALGLLLELEPEVELPQAASSASMANTSTRTPAPMMKRRVERRGAG